jgi:hypothetical protein
MRHPVEDVRNAGEKSGRLKLNEYNNMQSESKPEKNQTKTIMFYHVIEMMT